MSKHTIINSELLDALPALPDNTFDGILCDPPYELGFMGKSWDASGVVFSPATWAELLRVCKPGAALLAFGGTRTYHRLACAIEDAGWELRDCLQWVYGSGFPKSLDVSKALDKAAGAEREVVGNKGLHKFNGTRADKNKGRYGKDFRTFEQADALTAPSTEAARTWEGYGTALKPAYEPCLLARKPLEGTVAANVQKWGVGALWIDGGRVGTDDKISGGHASKGQQMTGGWERPWMSDPAAIAANAERARQANAKAEELGRWPSNLIHDGSPDVLAGFPETKSGSGNKNTGNRNNGETIGNGLGIGGDSGSAARFFYCAKASQRERNAGCEELPQRTAGECTGGREAGSPGLNSRRAGAGRTNGARNTHPCVKPLDLCRYIATLILPPAGRPHGPRKLLVPFSGSGSEMIAALMAGWDDVTGIEREAEYVEIAKHRLAHWTNAPQEYFPETLHELDQEHKPWAHLPLLEATHG